MSRVKWSLVVKEAVKLAQGFKQEVGEAPTLRALFYVLVSREIIPNTKSAYIRLSQVISAARLNGEYPWYLLKDESKPIIKNMEGDTLNHIKKHARDINKYTLEQVHNALQAIKYEKAAYWVRRWEEQPKQVIVCLEKGALKDAVQTVTKGWEVPLYVMKGYASTTQVKDLANRALSFESETVVLTLGDFDPSGVDISRSLHEKLETSFGVDCIVDRVAITQDQITAYKLPHDPDDVNERAKMKRDPRFKGWGHGFYRVELDALLAYRPDQFKRIIDAAIAAHFDEDTYEKVTSEAEECGKKAEAALEKLREEAGPLQEEAARLYNKYLAEAVDSAR